MYIYIFSDSKCYSILASRQQNFTQFKCHQQPHLTPFQCPWQPNFTPFGWPHNCSWLLWRGEAKQKPGKRFHSLNWGTLGLPPQNEEHCFTYIVTEQCISKQYTVQGTLYTVHYTLYIVYCTLYNVQCTLYTVHWTLDTDHWTVYTVNCTLYTIHCTLHYVFF